MTHVSTSREANLRGEQLELFPEGGVQAINPTHARSSVSPGWWPVVARLFAVEHAVVQECREVGGQLTVRATSAIGADQSLQALIARIRDDCEKACGCCGNWNARAFRGQLADVTRVVCDTCRERLQDGEAYLTIADEYWRLDGSRRPRQSRKAVQGAPRPNTKNTMRECGTLGAGELRATIAAFAARLRETIVGQEDAVSRLSLILGCHVGGGLARGARILIVGGSGVGKTSIIQSLRRALELEHWNVPFAAVDAVSLTSPGWTGLTVGGVLDAALGNADPHSMRARHAVCVVDEIHHIGVVDGLHGNVLAVRQEVIASLLALFGHGTTLRLGDSAREWSSENALVIALGAFTGLLDAERAPAPVDLVAAGLPLEFATRFDEVLVLRRLSEGQLIALLRQWPALLSLIEVCHRLGLAVRIVEETFTRAARAVTAGGDGSTARTAGGWLVAALRGEMIRAVGDPAVRELVLTPDSLAIARAAVRRRGPDDPPDASGGWDATIVLTPR